MNLKAPIKEAGITFRMQTRRLERLGIRTLEDLLYHIPQRYEDFSLVSKINLIQLGEVVTIQGNVVDIKNEYTRHRLVLQKAQVNDGTGIIECIWFNQPFILKNIKIGDFVSIAGKVEQSRRKFTLMVREYEVLEEGETPVHTARLVPVYPETRGLSSKWLRNRIKKLLDEHGQQIIEYLPSSILNNHNFIGLRDAFEQIHFPSDLKNAERAKQRLSFDELLLTQLTTLERRKEWEEKKVTHSFKISAFRNKITEFLNNLPFELTRAQKRAVGEIFSDLASHRSMNRILEGEVGSGKTVVSAIAMYVAHLNGFQSVLMAPTQILAEQHYVTISSLLKPLGVKVGLITGNKKSRIRNQELGIMGKKKNHDSSFVIHNSNWFDILIGTHALLSEKIKFEKLGLVVIDEQQRFGVEQRAMLRQKSSSPHFLTMTATPIPRTVFLMLYGDLDLSYLDEMPVGRQKVKTWMVPKYKREAAYEWIKEQIAGGTLHVDQEKKSKKLLAINRMPSAKNQVFIICPLIEESESMVTVKAATKEYERLKNTIFPEYFLGLLHGRLKTKEKQKVLEEFRNGKIDILVATPVVEVGIDIPNATIVLIEAAERFGLAQLHQLRGRVGRREKESYCLLFTEQKARAVTERLRLLEKVYNGAKLAEYDLKLRGPGEMYGTLQHGAPSLKIASFSDFPLIEKTRREADRIFPNLLSYPLLQEKVRSIIIAKVTPD